MSILSVVAALDDAIDALGPNAEVWTTSAVSRPTSISHATARERLHAEGPPVLIVFGTGWGLADSVCDRAHAHLEPIRSPRSDAYNHLSVRAAAAILFDRLCG
jgi:hypothetical protein